MENMLSISYGKYQKYVREKDKNKIKKDTLSVGILTKLRSLVNSKTASSNIRNNMESSCSPEEGARTFWALVIAELRAAPASPNKFN